VIDSNSPRRLKPALLITTSTRANFARAAVRAFVIDTVEVRSTG
jgi:hypothetical protein